jgi:uncharacterized membrane protein YesL
VALLLFGSLLFWLTCPLVITLPGGIAGLYAVLGPLIRSGKAEGEILRPFWATFRQTALTGLGLLVIDLLLALIVWADILFFRGVGALWGQGLALLIGAVGLVALMVNIFAWPLLAWYPQPLGRLLRRAFLLTGAHPLLALAGVAVLFMLPVLLAVLPSPLVAFVPALGPGLVFGLLGWIAWRAMSRYEAVEEEAV